jgi:hypothetical protein
MSSLPTVFISAAAHQRTLASRMAETRTETGETVIDAPAIAEHEPPTARIDPPSACTIRFTTTSPGTNPTKAKKGKKGEIDKLALCRETIETQPKSLQQDIESLAEAMLLQNAQVKLVALKLIPWTLATAESPFTPRSIRTKAKLDHSNLVPKDDTEYLRLKSLLETQVTDWYANGSSTMHLMAQREHAYVKLQRLQTFVKCTMDLFLMYTFDTTTVECEGVSHTYREDWDTFSTMILLDFIKKDDYLDEDFFLKYLNTSRLYIQSLICKARHPNTREKDVTLSNLRLEDHDQDEVEIGIKVQKAIGSFFLEVTSGLQSHLDAKIKTKSQAMKLEAFRRKNRIENCTAATQNALALEPRGNPETVNQLVNERVAAVLPRMVSQKLKEHRSKGLKNHKGSRNGTSTQPSKKPSPGPGKSKSSINPNGKNVEAAPPLTAPIPKRKRNHPISNQKEPKPRRRDTPNGNPEPNGSRRNANPDERHRGGARGRGKSKKQRRN